MSSAVVPRLCGALEDPRKPFILVLDDLHLVENPDCLDPLVEIVQSIPAGSQIAFASRTEPKLPLGRHAGRIACSPRSTPAIWR